MSMKLKYYLLLPFIITLFVGCNIDATEGVFEVKDEQLLLEILQEREDMSITVEAAKKCYIYNLLKSYGPYTVFAPTNQAWQQYFETKGITGLDDVEETVLEAIFEYHILPFEISTLNFQNGLMDEADTTANGYLLYIDLSGGLDNIKVNNKSLIIDGNIEAWNGMLHIVDHVLDPPVLSIADYLEKEEKYKKFYQFLDKYGISDTLSQLRQTEYPYDQNQFTVMAVPDHAMGKLYEIEDSILAMDARYEEFLGSDLNYANKVYPDQASEFAASFIISGIQYTPNLYSSFKKTLAKVPYGDNIMRMKVKVKENNIVINGKSTLVLENSDLIMKNGVIHECSDAFAYLAQSPREIIYSAYPHERWNTTIGANKENNSSNGYLGDGEYGIVRLKPSKVGAKFWVNIPNIPAGDYKLTLITKKGGSKAKILVNNKQMVFPGTNSEGIYDFEFILANRGRVDTRTPNPASSTNVNLYEIPTGNFKVNQGDENVEVALEVTYLNTGSPDIYISAIVIEPAVL